MNLIKLNATDSTNSFLSELAKTKPLESPTVVVTQNQTSGRGQRNAAWHFEPGKSLALSVYVEFDALLAKDQFYLSMLVALSVQKLLKDFGVPKPKVKWPNDILSHSKKLVGILIENSLKQTKIASSIIGIGINVNTQVLSSLPRLGSMSSQTNIQFDLEKVTDMLLEDLLPKLENLDTASFPKLKEKYEANLFKKDQVASFLDEEENLFLGIIRGVNEIGQLKIETSFSDTLLLYWPKEVTLQY